MAVKCRATYDFGRINFNQSEPLIDEWPHNWEHSPVTYRLNNLSPDIEKEEHQIRAVTVAFRVWQLRIKDIRFRREYDPDAHVDINIWFRPLSYFDNRRGILAHAYFPGQGEVSGDIEINDEWDWRASYKEQTLSKPALVPVLIHEIGHSLGLKHDTRTMDSFMYPSLDFGKKKYKLHKYDIERIQHRYGKRSLSQRILDYFANRRLEGYDFY